MDSLVSSRSTMTMPFTVSSRSRSGSRSNIDPVMSRFSRSGHDKDKDKDKENNPLLHPNVQLQIAGDPNKPTRATVLPDHPSSSSRPCPSCLKVFVRIRPVKPRGDDDVLTKVSSHSLSVGDRSFTFDSVLGSHSSQEDVFNLVGVPLVQDVLAGFNTSILSYGQTGTGKTYTLWGPPSAMLDGQSLSPLQGLVPRVFRLLFSEIHKKQQDQQTNYQCRCSFLEIYNEQINDLLDPTQKNLQIRDDKKNGFYVENLTDEYVTTIEDVTQILVKGLSNRKVGATNLNSKSSRSHIIFTCTVESYCKGTSSKYFSSSKSSKLSFIDLAGSDGDYLDGVGRQCRKEGKYIKQSLSKLGKLVHMLCEAGHSGKDEKIPYRVSCLTHLLKETLGGNSKLTLVCSISPHNRAGTLSTLRFGECGRRMPNKAVINEITEDDVNGLSDQIRQLKEELLRAKTYENNSTSAEGYYKGHNARQSLNQLRVGLNRSLILPFIDNEYEEELDVNEEDARELCGQLSKLPSSSEDNLEDILENKDSKCICSSEKILNERINSSVESDINFSCSQESLFAQEIIHSEVPQCEGIENASDTPLGIVKVRKDAPHTEQGDRVQDSSSKCGLSIIPSTHLPALEDPTLCASPKIGENLKKSTVTSSGIWSDRCHATENPNDISDNGNSKKCEIMHSSLRSSKVSPTESLAASLHRGLQIIDYHERNSAKDRPVISLSFEHLASISRRAMDKRDVAVQTVTEDEDCASAFLCSACKKADVTCYSMVDDKSGMQIVPVDVAGTLKDDNRSLANAIKRQMELERLCAEQAAMIKQLNSVDDNYKQKHDQSPITEQNQEETQNFCLQSLVGGVRPMKELVNDVYTCTCPTEEHAIPNRECMTTFDASEREALVEEIQSLKNKLKSLSKDTSMSNCLLEQIREGRMADMVLPHKREEFEKERQGWTESESRWICLTEELRLDLASNRRLAENKDAELRLEKKCTAELDDALQRAMVGHARMIEHYTELQEKYDSLLGRHRSVMEGIAEVKRAAKIAGSKRRGSAFVDALAAEISTLRAERERERAHLKEQNRSLKVQLRDTAEAVHAAGELLVRLREAEEAVALAEEKRAGAEQEADRLRKQMDKAKRKHAMEMVTMKHYLAESRLPESALEPLYSHERESAAAQANGEHEHGQSWRAAFGPAYT